MALPSNSQPVSVQVEGLKQLNKQLKRLSGREATNATRAAARAAASTIKKEASKNLPSEHRKKLAIERSRRQSSKTQHVFKVGPKKEHWQLIFLEFGVPSHPISTKKKQALYGSGYDHPTTQEITHPGIKKLAFLRRAFSSKYKEAEKMFVKKLNQRIEKALRK